MIMKHVNQFNDFKINEENSFEQRLSELKIKHYKKAIENLGNPDMQRIYIAANERGMGEAMRSGDYVDLSNSPYVYDGLIEALKKMLSDEEHKFATN